MKNLFKAFSLLLSVAAVSMTSCSKDQGQEIASTDSNGITFTENITATKVTGSSFDTNDVISVTAYNGNAVYVGNATYTYNGSIFSSTDPIVYTNDVTELSFLAVYPYTEVANGAADLSVATDQSADADYTASDILGASVATTSSESPKLTFSHLMSKIVFDVTIDDTIEVEGSISPKVNGYTKANGYNFANGTFTAASNSAITMANNGVNSYMAIIVPATYTTDNVFASMEINGTTYDVTLANDFTFEAGTQYTYSINITAPEPEEPEVIIIEITFDGEIQGWSDGGDLGDVDIVVDEDEEEEEEESTEDGAVTLVGRYTSNLSEYDSFFDLDAGVIYSDLELVNATTLADLIDVTFYTTATKTNDVITSYTHSLQGPQNITGGTSGKLKNWANIDSDSYLGGLSVLNSQSVYLAYTTDSSIITAFDEGNTANLSTYLANQTVPTAGSLDLTGTGYILVVRDNGSTTSGNGPSASTVTSYTAGIIKITTMPSTTADTTVDHSLVMEYIWNITFTK